MIDETKIMQLADGTLPQEEHEEVKKAIENDPKLKELYNTFKETGDLLFKLGNEINLNLYLKMYKKKSTYLKLGISQLLKNLDHLIYCLNSSNKLIWCFLLLLGILFEMHQA